MPSGAEQQQQLPLAQAASPVPPVPPPLPSRPLSQSPTIFFHHQQQQHQRSITRSPARGQREFLNANDDARNKSSPSCLSFKEELVKKHVQLTGNRLQHSTIEDRIDQAREDMLDESWPPFEDDNIMCGMPNERQDIRYQGQQQQRLIKGGNNNYYSHYIDNSCNYSHDEPVRAEAVEQPNNESYFRAHEQYYQSRSQPPPPPVGSHLPQLLRGKGDIKPFAYITNVTDPNSRGKLDLSQIKSVAMRRRLLANQRANVTSSSSSSSGEDDDNQDENVRRETWADEEDDDDDDQDEICYKSQANTRAPPVVMINSVPLSATRPANYAISEVQKSALVEKTQKAQPKSSGKPVDHHNNVNQVRIIHHKDPPVFYELQSQRQSQMHNSTQQQPQLKSNTNLDLEVVRSLDEFSEIIDGIDSELGNQCNGSGHEKLSREIQIVKPQTNRHMMSTFLPQSYSNTASSIINNINNSNDTTNNYSLAGQSRRTQSSSPGLNSYNISSGRYQHQTSNGIGDCLFSSDSNYFSAGSSSNSRPYSISPYYGSQFDLELAPHELTDTITSSTKTSTFGTNNIGDPKVQNSNVPNNSYANFSTFSSFPSTSDSSLYDNNNYCSDRRDTNYPGFESNPAMKMEKPFSSSYKTNNYIDQNQNNVSNNRHLIAESMLNEFNDGITQLYRQHYKMN